MRKAKAIIHGSELNAKEVEVWFHQFYVDVDNEPCAIVETMTGKVCTCWAYKLQFLPRIETLQHTTMEYIFTAPKYFKGETVRVRDHQRLQREGEIYKVETHWDEHFKAYHLYSVLVFGRAGMLHIREKKIEGKA